jgi:hypothetical protein
VSVNLALAATITAFVKKFLKGVSLAGMSIKTNMVTVFVSVDTLVTIKVSARKQQTLFLLVALANW